MASDVLVFPGEQTTFTTVESAGDVLVFAPVQVDLTQQTNPGRSDFIIFETPQAQTQEVLPDPEFLLVQTPVEMLAVEPVGEPERLMLTSGGGPKGIQGDRGEQGPRGFPGPPPTINFDSITTLPPGEPAEAVWVGTDGVYTLSLSIPQGYQGDKGDKGDENVVILNYGETIAQYETRTGKVVLPDSIIYEKAP